MRQIVAIEGIVHTGKSSLISALEKEGSLSGAQYITEYYEFIGGGQNFPGFPKDTNDALEANAFFSNLEYKRFTTFNDASSLVILDRSILSVLAYHYATERISRGRIRCFKQSADFFQNRFPRFFPDSCIYLTIDTDEMRQRHGDAGFYEDILLNDEFNRYLIEFYQKAEKLFPEITVITIDGKQDRQTVLLQAKKAITAAATRQ